MMQLIITETSTDHEKRKIHYTMKEKTNKQENKYEKKYSNNKSQK